MKGQTRAWHVLPADRRSGWTERPDMVVVDKQRKKADRYSNPE